MKIQILDKDDKIFELTGQAATANDSRDQDQRLETATSKNEGLRLEMTELKIAHQEVLQKLRQLTLRNEQLKSEGAMERANEMD